MLGVEGVTTNAHCPTALIEQVADVDAGGMQLLSDAADQMKFSARAYHRIMKVARTLADLDGAAQTGRIHVAEAISYRIAGERLASAAVLRCAGRIADAAMARAQPIAAC
jgi:magnesium chelatase family protein